MTSQELDKIEAAANNHSNPAMKRTLLRLVSEYRMLKTHLEGVEAQIVNMRVCRTVLERDLAVERECHHTAHKDRSVLINNIRDQETIIARQEAQLEDNKKKMVRMQEDYAVIGRNYALKLAQLQTVREQRNYLINKRTEFDRLIAALRDRIKCHDKEEEKHTQTLQALEHELAELRRHHVADQETIEALHGHNKFLGERLAEANACRKKKKCKAKQAVPNAPWITPLVFPALNTSTTTAMDNVSTMVEYKGTESGRCERTFFTLMVEALRD